MRGWAALVCVLAFGEPLFAQGPASVEPVATDAPPTEPKPAEPKPTEPKSAVPKAEEPKPADKPKFEFVWNNGLFIQTKEKDFVFHVGGLLHYDAAWYDATPGLETFPGGVGKFNDGAAPRRARIRLDGTIWENCEYVLEFDFANAQTPAGLQGPAAVAGTFGTPNPVEVWVMATDVPFVKNVRIGYQREPFSFEAANSARYLEFMERSYLFDSTQLTAFNNGRSPGVAAYRTWANERVFTAIGAFRNVSDPYGFGVGDGEYAVTGRATWLPVYEPKMERYWLVGGAMSHREPVAGQVRVRARNSVRAAPGPLLNLLADTGAINTDTQTLFNLQTAAVHGPVTVQAEYVANVLGGTRVGTGPPLGTLFFQGYYVEAMYFLTGESRPFDPQLARYKGVTPKRNFGGGGWGAWEVAARYSYLGLSDGGVSGGRLNGVTLGLNWYWNPNVKMQFNYDYVHRDRAANPLASGQVHSLGTRMAISF